MNLGVISLVALAVAIAIGYFKGSNVGIICLAFAMVLSLVSGDIRTADLIKGFSSSLLIQMVGVTYLFAIVNANGTLELAAKKAVGLLGKNRAFIPVVMFLLGAVLSGIGPGAIPCLAIIPVIAIPVAVSSGINPIMLAIIGDLGVQATRMSPLTPEAAVVNDLMLKQNITGGTVPIIWAMVVTCVILAVCVYIYYKGWKTDNEVAESTQKLPPLNVHQIESLIGLLVLAVGVLFLKWNVGFTGFTVGSVLVFLGAGDDGKAMKMIPWNVIFMVMGVGVLMSIVGKSGGISLLVAGLEKIMNQKTASSVMGFAAGIMSFFSSGLGVVFPTLIPTAGGIAASSGADAVEICAAVVSGGTFTGYSPISTAGALIMAGVWQQKDAEKKFSQNRIFIELFAISFIALIVLVALAYFGVYGLAVKL